MHKHGGGRFALTRYGLNHNKADLRLEELRLVTLGSLPATTHLTSAHLSFDIRGKQYLDVSYESIIVLIYCCSHQTAETAASLSSSLEMAAMRGPRLQVGSAPWVAEERSSALQIAQSEVEEFSYSARNELDWLNEHMAGIFDENETYASRNSCRIVKLTCSPATLQKHLKPLENFVEGRLTRQESQKPRKLAW